MEYSRVNLNDLPDEILLLILKKLHNVEVLYSLIGVNKRLDAIVNDSIFTSYLTLMIASSDGLFYRFSDTILDRFYQQILPKIHHKINWLNLESLWIERILLSTDYPNLCGLGLYNLSLEAAKDLFIDESFLLRIFKNQISSLVIKITTSGIPLLDLPKNMFIFTQIITMFSNLRYLNYDPSDYGYNLLSFGTSPPIFFSSNLLELRVALRTYTDCLYLLDGRFDQLHTVYISISHVGDTSIPTIDNKNKLSGLKCFSLNHDSVVVLYDEFIVPLLQRMSNLENLGLYFINRSGVIIDGDKLENNIMKYMTKLNKFIFNIRSITSLYNQINLPSNKDIQYTFRNFKGAQIISCVDCFTEKNEYHCHVYSHPYTYTYYKKITNNFPGGLFPYVSHVSLFDEHPFGHEFFLRIAQSFPLMERLTLHNRKPQKNDNQQWSIIEYPHLDTLDLVRVHDDYIEQFLLDTKMCLPNYVNLFIAYESLQRVTENFTRDATRINCSKVDCLRLHKVPSCFQFQYVEHYFPNAEFH